MAEAVSTVVADNVELVANNIQDKVGSTLVGTKNLAADYAGGISELLVVQLDGIRTLQTSAVEYLSELVEVMKAQFTFDKDKLRQTSEQEEKTRKPKGKGGPRSELQQLGDWLKDMDMGNLKGMGLAGGIAGLTSMLGKAIFSKTTALIAGLAWAIFDGFAGAKLWGGIPGFVGGFFGGLNKGVLGMAAGAGKWALIGAGLGSVIPGVGTLIGLIGGALFGGLLGWFGGERITGWINNIIALPTAMMEKIVEVFTDIKNSVVDAVTGYVDWYVGLVKAIFKPIISTFKKILNVIKSVLNSVIESIPDFGFDKIKELKEKMKFDIEPEGKAITESQAGGVDSVESLSKATDAVSGDVMDDGQVSQENIANLTKASDEMIENMNAEDMMKHKGYAKYIVNSVNRAVQEIMKMSNAEGLSKEDAKQLQLKATQLAEKLKEVKNEYNAKSKEKIITREDGTVVEQVNESKSEDETKLEALQLQKIADERAIAELEDKISRGAGGRGAKGRLKTKKKKLAVLKEDISKQESLVVEDIDFPIVKNTIDKKAIVKDKKSLVPIDKGTAAVAITKVDGSPVVATNKHISMIQHKGIFPVDPTMMAALAGYSK